MQTNGAKLYHGLSNLSFPIYFPLSKNSALVILYSCIFVNNYIEMRAELPEPACSFAWTC